MGAARADSNKRQKRLHPRVFFQSKNLKQGTHLIDGLAAKLTQIRSQKIAIDKLSPGLYFYTIREQNNITLSGKLVKK